MNEYAGNFKDAVAQVKEHRLQSAAAGATAEMNVTKVHDDGWIEGYSADAGCWFATKLDRLLTVRGEGYLHGVDRAPEIGDRVAF